MAQRQFLSFYLNKDLFGIDLILVREILRKFDVTSVDHAPEHISGVMNLRGQIVTLIDLKTKLDIKTEGGISQEINEPDGKPESSDKHCIFLKTSTELERLKQTESEASKAPEEAVGLIVDGVEEVYSVDTRCIEPPPANLRGVDAKMISSVVKLQNRLLMIIDSSHATGN